MRRIYNTVQLRLPSAYAKDAHSEGSEGDGSEEEGGFAGPMEQTEELKEAGDFTLRSGFFEGFGWKVYRVWPLKLYSVPFTG